MNELKVLKQESKIVTNFKDFHKEIKKAVEDYKGLVVSEDNLSEMKQTRLELTRTIKLIDDRRKEVKKEFQKPLKEFEDDCKTAIATVQEAENELKAKIDVYDEQVRQAHLDYAQEVAGVLIGEYNLTDKFAKRIDVVKNFENLTMTNKKIEKDIVDQVKELANLQETEKRNIEYVSNQLVTASKLAGLSTSLVIDDISHLIDSYEAMDVAKVTNGITSVAMRRKEAEELAIKQAEERIRKEEELKAREKAEREIKEKQKEEQEKQTEEQNEKQIKKDRALEEELMKIQDEEDALAFKPQENQTIDDKIEEENIFCFESNEDDNEFTVMTLRFHCSKKETIEIMRLLAINKYDFERID